MKTKKVFVILFISIVATLNYSISSNDKSFDSDLVVLNIEALAAETGEQLTPGYRFEQQKIVAAILYTPYSGPGFSHEKIPCCIRTGNAIDGCNLSMADSRCK